MNKQLADWIKSEEAQGYSEKQLRDYLIKQGYNSKDVDKVLKKPSLLNSLKYILISLFSLNILIIILQFIYAESLTYRRYFPSWFGNEILMIIIYFLPALICSFMSANKISKLNGTIKNALFTGSIIGLTTSLMLFGIIKLFESYIDFEEFVLFVVIILISSIFMGLVSWFVRKSNLKKYPEINNLSWLPEEEPIHIAPKPFRLKDVFKPTILKCFFPALILIFILVSFFINSTHIPPVAKHMCDSLNNAEELRDFNEQVKEKSLENNADPQELINLYQQKETLRKQSISSRNVFAEHLKP
ncbi:MAG: hypothetical protein GXP63_00435, partial [DPANN group archaeon]|nr:hypothetical protein [DPANN group archaeon]